MNLRVGSLVYATNQGIGILARAFHSNGIITHPFVIEHYHRKNHLEWYPGAPRSKIKPLNLRYIEQAMNELDVLLCIESPYHWNIFNYCREHKPRVATALVTMYECGL